MEWILPHKSLNKGATETFLEHDQACLLRSGLRIDSRTDEVVPFNAKAPKMPHRFPMEQIHRTCNRLSKRPAVDIVGGVITEWEDGTALHRAIMFADENLDLTFKAFDIPP